MKGSNGRTKRRPKHRGPRYGIVELCNAVHARLKADRPGWRVRWERDDDDIIHILALHDAQWAQRTWVAKTWIAPWALRAYPMHGVATVVADKLVELIDEILRDIANGGLDAVAMRPGLAARAKEGLASSLG